MGRVDETPESLLAPGSAPLLTLPDTTPVDEDLHSEGGVGRLVAVQQEGVAAQGGHVGGKDHGALCRGEQLR